MSSDLFNNEMQLIKKLQYSRYLDSKIKKWIIDNNIITNARVIAANKIVAFVKTHWFKPECIK